jgi:aryl-alcohol dehydrogenase-like predicted oxidoreductase
MLDPTRTAIGTWSGGRFMHFGEPLDDERLAALLRPDDRVRTVITADAYGAGEADALLGRGLEGVARDSYCLVGAVGHDFYAGEREGAKGFPRFTDPRLRDADGYASYLRMAAERSLERTGADRFDLLLLHNPDRTGYTSAAVWDGMDALRDAGLTRRLGIAPGPANGFTLDLLDCFERFGALIDWAMVILNPLEPWPGELVLDAARHHGVELMRPVAERHGLTVLQLACQWNLAHAPVRCVAPTLIQEPGAGAKPIEAKREELAALPAADLLSRDEVAALRAIGDNTGSMTLKGAAPDFEGEPRPDRWALTPQLAELAARWGIEPARDLQTA